MKSNFSFIKRDRFLRLTGNLYLISSPTFYFLHLKGKIILQNKKKGGKKKLLIFNSQTFIILSNPDLTKRRIAKQNRSIFEPSRISRISNDGALNRPEHVRIVYQIDWRSSNVSNPRHAITEDLWCPASKSPGCLWHCWAGKLTIHWKKRQFIILHLRVSIATFNRLFNFPHFTNNPVCYIIKDIYLYIYIFLKTDNRIWGELNNQYNFRLECINIHIFNLSRNLEIWKVSLISNYIYNENVKYSLFNTKILGIKFSLVDNG